MSQITGNGDVSDQVLKLFKADLGIMHSKRDEYLSSVIVAALGDLHEKGILIDLERVEDQILLSDFAAWKYRKRTENIGISNNLQCRIRNRILKERASRNV